MTAFGKAYQITDTLVREFGRTKFLIEVGLDHVNLHQIDADDLKHRQRQVAAAWKAFIETK